MDKPFIKNPVEAYEKLKEENKKLKAENEALKNNDVFSIRLFKGKADQYKQALKEIKEIAEKPITTIKYTERECYGDAEWSELRGKCALGRQILRKISEVIDD